MPIRDLIPWGSNKGNKIAKREEDTSSAASAFATAYGAYRLLALFLRAPDLLGPRSASRRRCRAQPMRLASDWVVRR